MFVKLKNDFIFIRKQWYFPIKTLSKASRLVFLSPGCVWLFVIPWTAAYQAPLYFAISWSLLQFMSTESAMLSNQLILCHLLVLLPSISLQSKRLSRVFSSTTIRKHQFFSAQPSLWSNSHILNRKTKQKP